MVTAEPTVVFILCLVPAGVLCLVSGGDPWTGRGGEEGEGGEGGDF